MNEASVGFQCPECVVEGRRTTRRPATAFGGSEIGQRGYVTKALIGINVLVMLWAVALGGMKTLIGGGLAGLMGSANELTAWGAVVGYDKWTALDTTMHGVAAGEWWRLITAMFLHYGLLHLAMNMYVLWQLGGNLEAALGPWRFLALYLLSGLGGNVAAFVFSDPAAYTAGASTAIFGLFAALFVLLRRLKQNAGAIVPIIIVNVVFTISFASFVSVPGHIGGLFAGGVAAAVLAYAPRERRTLVQAVGCAVVLVVLLGITAGRAMSLTG